MQPDAAGMRAVGLHQARRVVSGTRHEVRRQLGFHLHVGLAQAVHAGHPERVLVVHLGQAHVGRPADPQHERKQ